MPLSQSVLWRMQSDYYAQRGVSVWTEDAVPQFITNNPLLAEAYARIVLEFVRASGGAVRILELGAGTGKFAYLFLGQLQRMMSDGGERAASVRYCMADCSEAALQAWRKNERLAALDTTGLLEFELWRAGEEGKLRFLAGPPGPLVVIANYLFDSLPQDAFVIRDGSICEALVTTTQAEGKRPERSFHEVPVASERFSEPAWNAILAAYRQRLQRATVLFPTRALEILRTLDTKHDGRMLLLCADKGFAYEEELEFAQGDPVFEFHADQCFSQTVNFDAIGKYFQATGGTAMLPDKHAPGFRVCGFLRGRAGEVSRTLAAYRQAQAQVGVDDVFALLSWLHPHMQTMSIAHSLAVLRLTRWDPVAFSSIFPALARQLSAVTTERHDLREGVLRVWENRFPVSSVDNELAFQCGAILLGLKFHSDAEAMFRVSQQSLGPSAATSYNLGLCAQAGGRQADALAYMTEACVLDPNFEPARVFRNELLHKTTD